MGRSVEKGQSEIFILKDHRKLIVKVLIRIEKENQFNFLTVKLV